MLFSTLSHYFAELEKTTLRNKITEILADLFKKTEPGTIGQICYLLQGRVSPLYLPIEFGIADKLVIRALAVSLDIDAAAVTKEFKKLGDIGLAVELLKKHPQPQKQLSLMKPIKSSDNNITVYDVFSKLSKLAVSTGAGSQEVKLNILAELIGASDPLSARFIVRIVLGKLRLGFSDMTILDALSWMETGDKSARPLIEAAYNVRPDISFIAETVKGKGSNGLKRVISVIGTPIRMARANRLSSAAEILEKIGTCAIEYKYDGLRLQVHYDKKSKIQNPKSKQKEPLIKLFSRNLEEITPMFPDIAESAQKQIQADDVIFEGEVVAYNPKTGVFVPFQETMQRKRKYDIAAKALEIPVKLFAFELLYLNGKSYLDAPYSVRKDMLKKVVKTGDTIVYAQEKKASDVKTIEGMFADSLKKNFEGIIAKKLDGLYEAGVRGWNWIKFKHAMSQKLMDTFDVVVMGYTKGEGKRTDFGVGQFLTGVYDSKQDKFVTVTKIGTGLTDEQFHEFFKRVSKFHAKGKPLRYEIDKLLTPDVWLEPHLVVEVSCDEITRSAVHTAGRVMEPSKSGKALSVKTPGFALRFPRLKRFRDDKRPEDATTVKEMAEMFAKQK